MIPKIDRWTIVIPGAWNVRIFSPEWMGKYLFENNEQIKVELNIESAIFKIRFSTDNLVLMPANDRFIIGVKNITDETLQMAEKVARKLLDTLSHTPFRAFGVNFGFIEQNPPPGLISLFELNDLLKISGFGAIVKSTEITRKLIINDEIINIKQTLNEQSNIEIRLNFHYAINSTELACDKLLNLIVPCRDTAYNLLDAIYTLKLDEESAI
ncbi:MAG: hypothetical protein WCF59_04125 [Desulfobaccales bacterium]